MANNQQLLLGEGAGGAPAVYIEDVFSTYLYTGNGSTQTITNNIDLSTKGGLVWSKDRSGTNSHRLYDTVRGGNKSLSTNQTAAQDTWSAPYIMTFNSNGYETGLLNNESSFKYASWTFRKQPKFFDIVTYTGNGSGLRSISHSLGSTPGVAILKKTSTTSDWIVTDPGGALGSYGFQPLYLNNTNAKEGFNQTGVYSADATSIYVGSNIFSTGTDFGSNDSGVTYVAYLFAHNAGGFGLAGTDNVISCGSYTGAGSPYTGGSEINLGYEPQWVLIKSADNATNWVMIDNMRGWEAGTSGLQNWLYANTSGAENTGGSLAYITSTGFKPYGSSLTNNTGTYIYIAIRRGPMKVPTVGTSVFSPTLATVAEGTGAILTTNFPIDLQVMNYTPGTSSNSGFLDRLRGIATTTTQSGQRLISSATSAEAVASVTRSWDNTGFQVSSAFNNTRTIYWNFRRAPGFFDEVCWTGDNGANQRVSHNLGVAPELIIYKGRNKVNYWRVYFGDINKYIRLDAGIAAVSGSNFWGSSAPTTTDFGINCGSMDLDNFNAVGYLFATCAGVSKVGTYTGTAAAQVINCGFTSGARFVLIKRTDSTGDWYVWDSARGIIAGNDPYLLLNSTAAEVTSTDYIDTDTTGFEISSTAPAAINASAGTFIFLAIA